MSDEQATLIPEDPAAPAADAEMVAAALRVSSELSTKPHRFKFKKPEGEFWYILKFE